MESNYDEDEMEKWKMGRRQKNAEMSYDEKIKKESTTLKRGNLLCRNENRK